MDRLRATWILLVFFTLTPPLMVLQWVLLRVAPRQAVRFPHFYHRNLCRLLQGRIHILGEPADVGPCLITANHCSWLDIVVLSAVRPLSFVAKREVGAWPFFGSLARLQRTIFVDRDRRSSTARFKAVIQSRLRAGDTLVLFPEGTSTDGNRVLEFKSALMGAAEATYPEGTKGIETAVTVQPVTLAYTRVHGMPLGRHERPVLSWYGDMELAPHLWAALKRGPFDAVVQFHPPVSLASLGNRKMLAAHCEQTVRDGLVAVLAGREHGKTETPDANSPSPG